MLDTTRQDLKHGEDAVASGSHCSGTARLWHSRSTPYVLPLTSRVRVGCRTTIDLRSNGASARLTSDWASACVCQISGTRIPRASLEVGRKAPPERLREPPQRPQAHLAD